MIVSRSVLCWVAAGLVGVDCRAAQDVETVVDESFDAFEAGPFPAGSRGWSLIQQTKTRAMLAPQAEGGKALRIIDNHIARGNASCLIRRSFEPVAGKCRVRVRMMMRQGETDGVSQDMGLNLYGGRRAVLNVFFSGGEIKVWQGKTWASLEPPVRWMDGRWYDVELRIDLDSGSVAVTVDGAKRSSVTVRSRAASLNRIDLTSQRGARGELWVDYVRIDHKLPPELCTRPSAEWRSASEDERMTQWFADDANTVGDEISAAMRRLVSAHMGRWPLLCFNVAAAGGTEYSLFVRPTDGSRAVPVERRSREYGMREYDLFALTGWEGRRTFELLLSSRGGNGVRARDLTVKQCPPLDYLSHPSAVWRFVQPSRGRNALAGPLSLAAIGEPGGLSHITQGIPFAQRVLSDSSALALTDEHGKHLPIQTQTLSVWPDGTVRWLLIDTQAELPPTGRTTLTLANAEPKPASPELATDREGSIAIDADDIRLRVPANVYGPIEGLPAGLDGRWDFVARFDDRQFSASRGTYSARIETNGPLRSTICIAGTLSDGRESAFTYELRISAFRGIPQIQLDPTFTLVCEAREVHLQEVSLVLGGTFPTGPMTLGMDTPVAVVRQRGQTAHLTQASLNHCAAVVDTTEKARGKRASGWMTSGRLTVAVRRFWQQFAKRLALSDRELRIELWSPKASPRRFGRGAAKTHSLLLAFHPEDVSPRAIAAKFEHPPTLHPGAESYAASRAMGQFPLPSKSHAEIDALYEYALARRLHEQQRRAHNSFGMVHYGDIGHINSEIDAHKAFFIQWARTGARKWLDFALDWARHSQDLDVCHYSPNPREIGIHHSHYAPDHNNYSLTLTHTWIEGQLYRYYLTGDRRSLMAADLAGRAFSRSMLTSGQMFDAGRKGGGIGSRAYGRACWALCELHRATRNPRYLWAMKRLTGYLVSSLRPDGAVPASHDGNGHWRTTDECPHMAAICAAGLARYAELSGDRTVVPHLERIAKWQMSRGAMPEKLGIMYHNYQGGEVIHFVDACADMLEAWAFLYDATGNALYRDFSETVYDTMIEMGDRWRHDWTLCIRNVLYYLARRDRWPDRPTPPKVPPGSGATITWLQSCQNPEGGFGLAPGIPSDMDSTFRAVDALEILGAGPLRARPCTDWILSCRNTDGGYAGEPGWHSNVAWTWFAVAVLSGLDAKPPEPQKTIDWLNSAANDDGGNGSSPITGRLAYHAAWHSSCEYTAYKAQALQCLQAEPKARSKMIAFLQSLQTKESGFRCRSGGPTSGYTMDALDGLTALAATPLDANACARWLNSLRRADGGYGWPNSNRSSLRSTAHSILSLSRLDRLPDIDQCETTVRCVLTCQSKQGGFGHRPGHTPTVTSTWHAIRAMSALSRH